MFKCLNVKMNRGFTLIEMMVTVLIFSIIIGTATGVFVSAIRLQKYNLTYQQLLDQTSYAMEYMSRAIRMAKKDEGGDCIGAGTNYFKTGFDEEDALAFKDYHGNCRFFYVLGTDGELKDSDPSLPLIKSNKFEVTSLKFNVSGDASGEQPRVTIFMEIKGKGLGHQPKIQIQTTISQRDLD